MFLLNSYLTLILCVHSTIKLDLLTTCCTIDYAKGRYQVIIVTDAYIWIVIIVYLQSTWWIIYHVKYHISHVYPLLWMIYDSQWLLTRRSWKRPTYYNTTVPKLHDILSSRTRPLCWKREKLYVQKLNINIFLHVN